MRGAPASVLANAVTPFVCQFAAPAAAADSPLSATTADTTPTLKTRNASLSLPSHRLLMMYAALGPCTV